ncbi:XRE family transcriptional regulator [Prosthecomicrobium hirschii]|nr:XRE family transcriptional regulator [Prosthecomicrobium hirschii]
MSLWDAMDSAARAGAVRSRLARGLGQDAVAAELGISRQTVSRWAGLGCGAREAPRLEVAALVPGDLAARNAEVVRLAGRGASGPQIAAALGMTPSAVSGVLHRAREKGDRDARCRAGRFGVTVDPAVRDAVLAGVRAGHSLGRIAAAVGKSKGKVRGIVDRHWPADEPRPQLADGFGRILPRRAEAGSALRPAVGRASGARAVRRAPEPPAAGTVVALIDRRRDQCAYPTDTRDAAGLMQVCGGAIEDGGAWCAWHRRIVYVSPADRAREAAAREAAVAQAIGVAQAAGGAA